MFCIRWAQLDNGVVFLTLYTEDSGKATSLVRNCDHNKRNAAAINEISLSTFIFHYKIFPQVIKRFSLTDQKKNKVWSANFSV